MSTDVQQILRVAIPIGVVIVVLVIAGIGLLLYRRTLFGQKRSLAGSNTSNMLESLRHMRDNGELSESEYQLARRNLIAKTAEPDRTGAGSAKIESLSPKQPGAKSASKIQTKGHNQGELRAMPGFDLTGEPLPESGQTGHAQE